MLAVHENLNVQRRKTKYASVTLQVYVLGKEIRQNKEDFIEQQLLVPSRSVTKLRKCIYVLIVETANKYVVKN